MSAGRRFGFVAVVVGVLLAGSLPLYSVPGHSCAGKGFCAGVDISSPEGVMGVHDLAHPRWLEVYWAVALVVACGLVLRRYRRAGELRRAVPALGAGVLLAGVTAVLTVEDWPGFRSPSAVVESARLLVFNGGTPLLISAVVLVVLAVSERSLWLVAASLGYAVVAYFAATYDSLYLLHLNLVEDPSGIRFVVNIAIPAGLLLVTGGLAGLGGRTSGARSSGRWRRAAPHR